MICIKPQFITVDDFNNYWGMDLNEMLRENDNESNKADAFLCRVEDRVMTFVDSNTFRNVPWNKLTPFQLKLFQKALVTQALYMWKNGDLGIDSGYDQEHGFVADRGEIKSITICSATLDFLKNAGLYNQRISARRRYSRYYGWYGPLS